MIFKKILIVCSGNVENFNIKIHKSFIYEQVKSLEKLGYKFEFFFIRGKGVFGYLSNLTSYIKVLKKNKFDYVHAHGGDSISLSILQRKVPVIGTYHGSDINLLSRRILSNFSSLFLKKIIVVERSMVKKIFFKSDVNIIPCGIDLKKFKVLNKSKSRLKLNINLNTKLILFSSNFDNKNKNSKLAINAINKINNNKNISLVELNNMTREQVCLYMNAADLALMTSFQEGSPQFIKEAMACNTPIVSTDVGDVKRLIEGIEGCFICTKNINDVSSKILKALEYDSVNSRSKLDLISLDKIANKISKIYC